MNFHAFVFNSLQENTYLLWDEDTKDAVVIDPGMCSNRENMLFARFLEERGLHLVLCLQTHCHFDHIFGLDFIYNRYELRPRFAEREKSVYDAMPSWSPFFGVELREPLPPAGEYLTQGEVIRMGNTDIQVISTPGHTPGGVCFYLPSEHIAFTGDTIFRGSMGRTDLGGDEYDLRTSILQSVLTLPADTKVYPGHGPATTISEERVNWGV